ncbi:Detected protein of confused Function [Hibiscus syriacus]|uniref:Detected protein of confused Function n=1 Tax=Hibiscus syriacus TaxID=106335 RepID=A0A6A3C0S5_HIBSY|nr:Detected protein of confused Function [Hibiscus syriacus]
MATFNDNNSNDHQESSPLLAKQVLDEDLKEKPNGKKSKEHTAEVSPLPVFSTGHGFGWTADGLPLVHRSVLGEPLGRSQWNSSLFACLGRNDEFCSSDIEVCLLGSVVPCVLHGTNVERLGSDPGTFVNHCLPYSALYLIVCHPCAVCQEGREVRRRLHHPGFNAQAVLAMAPPGEQTMARGA